MSYNSSEFYNLLPVHILLTVNYDGEAKNIVHHAITAWTESISKSQFTACALKAGRNEYQRGIPSRYGTTYVDWVAFQGSPKGGVDGEELIADWWEGTTCKLVSLPKVSGLCSDSFCAFDTEEVYWRILGCFSRGTRCRNCDYCRIFLYVFFMRIFFGRETKCNAAVDHRELNLDTSSIWLRICIYL